MKIIEMHEYRFPSWLLPTLINGDPIENDKPILPSGETGQDCLDDFIDRLERFSQLYGASHYTIDYDSESYFSRTNCLYNLGGNVTDIKVYFFR